MEREGGNESNEAPKCCERLASSTIGCCKIEVCERHENRNNFQIIQTATMGATIIGLVTHGIFPVILGNRVNFWKWSALQYALSSQIATSSVIPLTIVALFQAIALPHEIPCLLLPGIIMSVCFSASVY